MVWEQLGKARIGAGTGLYYLFSMSAAIFGPLISGMIFDLTSISILFPLSIGFLIIAFVLMLTVKTGEVGDEATLFLVIRDERGGAGWTVRDVRVEP